MAVYKSKKATKDGRQYFFRIKYKDIFGEVHDYSSPKFKNKKDAESEEAKYRVKVNNKEAYVSVLTIKQVYAEMMALKKNQVKKQTILKEYNLYKYFKKIEDKKINEISVKMYNELVINNFSDKLSVTYKNKIIGLFKRIIIYSNKMHNTSDSILKHVNNFKAINEIKKEMNFFTYDEYLEFDKIIDDFNFHCFYESLYFMGLRQGECQALTWEDIDFEKNTMRINKTLTTKIKGEKYTISSPKTKSSNRILPLTEKLSKDLKIMYNNARQYNDFSNQWFVFGNTLPFPETTIQKRKNDYCDKTPSKKRIRIHDFRHSCASLLINQGASIALVSKYLGHSNTAITLNTYTHMFESELNKMTDILNKL